MPAGRRAAGQRATRVFNARSAGLALVNAGIFVYLSFETTDYFTHRNIVNLLVQMVPIGIAGLGTAPLIITGNIDLSIGSIYGLAAVSSAMLAKDMNPQLAIVVAVLIAAGCGLVNGLLVWRIRISPIIITLGTLTALLAVVELITQGEAVANVPNAYSDLGNYTLWQVPATVYIMLGGVVVVGVVLSRTTIGLHMYAIGGNREAADMAGVRVRRIIIGTFVFNGALAGFAGILEASRFGTADPTYGVNFNLSVITAVILGGVAFAGGEGTITGATLGVVFITLINSGIVAIGINAYYGTMVQGLALVVAVAIDQLVLEQRDRHRKAVAMRENQLVPDTATGAALAASALQIGETDDGAGLLARNASEI
ncbi:MAG TPA: ABC transporter permease [Acidimicrobiales bacterium]|nr:ABC transporter permease [Acidimicrobiales bacterium]